MYHVTEILRCVTENKFHFKAGITSYARGLRDISSSLYVRRFFRPEAKAQMVAMTGHVREAFAETLEAVDWMDNATRAEAAAKLESMLQNIGYPEEILDEGLMEELHQGLELKPGEFFESTLAISR